VLTPVFVSWDEGYNGLMRKAIGIVLIALGTVGLFICGIVMLRLGSVVEFLSPVGIVGFHIHPVESPVFSVLFLAVGLLLLRGPRATESK
jgi:hypothetical protein